MHFLQYAQPALQQETGVCGLSSMEYTSGELRKQQQPRSPHHQLLQQPNFFIQQQGYLITAPHESQWNFLGETHKTASLVFPTQEWFVPNTLHFVNLDLLPCSIKNQTFQHPSNINESRLRIENRAQYKPYLEMVICSFKLFYKD